MRYLSICSGIEAATCAWHQLGWKAAGFAEIAAFPSAVIAARWPDVENYGDFTGIRKSDCGSIDLLCGGTPCQSFSVAGLRTGLHDDRGNLALEYFRLALRVHPRWLLWENVPGVLSANKGRDFGAILRAMAECGYGYAYRVLDAQYFGIPQQRRRVFLVGYLGDWRPAAAVLFERQSLRGYSPARRKARQAVAALTATGIGIYGADDNQAQAGHLIDCTPQGISGAVSSKWHKGTGGPAGDEHYNLVVPIQSIQSVRENRQNGIGVGDPGGPMYTLTAKDRHAIAFDCKASGRNGFGVGEKAPTMRAMGHSGSRANGGGHIAVAQPGLAVRRLTPLECERLQGFPDHYTAVTYRNKPAPDNQRYIALGNSMAVPVMSWLGRRMDTVDQIVRMGMAA